MHYHLLLALFVYFTVLPATSHAVRLVDRNYELSRLEANSCIAKEDYRRLGIFPNRNGDKGFQANFHSEKDLFELLTKLYGCDFLQSESSVPKEAYLISMNNRKEDGTVRTILEALTLTMESAIHMPGKMALYSSIESLKSSKGFAEVVKGYGKSNVFFQGFNVETYEYIGLFDTEGLILVDADGTLIE